jgi:hypothetical protein
MCEIEATLTALQEELNKYAFTDTHVGGCVWELRSRTREGGLGVHSQIDSCDLILPLST